MKKTIIQEIGKAEYTEQDLKRIEKIRNSIILAKENERRSLNPKHDPESEIPVIAGDEDNPFDYKTEEERRAKFEQYKRGKNQEDDTKDLLNMIKNSKWILANLG